MRAWVGVVLAACACVALPLACDGSSGTEDEVGGASGSGSDGSGGRASGGAGTGGGDHGGEGGANLGGGGLGGEPSDGQGGFAGAYGGPILPCPNACHLAYAQCTGSECDPQDFECLDQCNLDRSDCLIACM